MSRLTELGRHHGTDKADFHGYTEIYERYLAPLRLQTEALLEIGVAGGASLRMWYDYFPKAQIIGVDHNQQFINDCTQKFVDEGRSNRIRLCCREVTILQLWSDFCPMLDVVVDDGGHFSSQIIKAFANVWPRLKPGGLYFIEDTHAIYQHDPGMSFFAWLEQQIHSRVNEHGLNQCGRPVNCDFEFVHLYKSFVVIKKR